MAWGFSSTGPLIYNADMMAYTRTILENSFALVNPPEITDRQLEYLHLCWLSVVVVTTLNAAQCRFSTLHGLSYFEDTSAAVLIDKFFLAMLDKSISHMSIDDRSMAMREFHVVDRGVQPNHFLTKYSCLAEPIVEFLQSWVPVAPLEDVEVVDSSSSDHIDAVHSDANSDSSDSDSDDTTS